MSSRIEAFVLLFLLIVVSLPVSAQVYYTVNGMPAAPNVAVYMASNGLPPGHYWLNAQGYWGIVGNPIPYGNINAQSNYPARRPSLSERGMLFRPGEILNGR